MSRASAAQTVVWCGPKVQSRLSLLFHPHILSQSPSHTQKVKCANNSYCSLLRAATPWASFRNIVWGLLTFTIGHQVFPHITHSNCAPRMVMASPRAPNPPPSACNLSSEAPATAGTAGAGAGATAGADAVTPTAPPTGPPSDSTSATTAGGGDAISDEAARAALTGTHCTLIHS